MLTTEMIPVAAPTVEADDVAPIMFAKVGSVAVLLLLRLRPLVSWFVSKVACSVWG